MNCRVSSIKIEMKLRSPLKTSKFISHGKISFYKESSQGQNQKQVPGPWSHRHEPPSSVLEPSSLLTGLHSNSLRPEVTALKNVGEAVRLWGQRGSTNKSGPFSQALHSKMKSPTWLLVLTIKGQSHNIRHPKTDSHCLNARGAKGKASIFLKVRI